MSLTAARPVDVDSAGGSEKRRGVPAGWLPYLIAFFFFCVYSAWSVSRHRRHQTSGYDLGIFEQAVRGYAGFGPPISTIKAPGFNLLGDHFHPILIVLSPFYQLFPSPLTLLLAQAALLAVSAVPVIRLVNNHAGLWAGSAAGIAYGLSWGLQSAVDFDFHEIAFAVPLLSYSLVAVVDERWRHAALWAAPLILVKEDLSATLAAIGAVMFLRGQRRIGGAVVGFAVAAGLTIVTVIIPALNPEHVYPYTHSVVADHQNPVHRLFAPAAKWRTLVQLFAPTGFGALFSSITLVAVPTLAWRFWSTDPLYWGTSFQYSAILMPIVFIAFIETTTRLRPSRGTAFLFRGAAVLFRGAAVLFRGAAVLFPGAAHRRRAALLAAALVALTSTVVTPWPLSGLLHTRNWQVNRAVRDADLIVADVPRGATVAADNRLAPQLTARCTVYFFPAYPNSEIRPEWVVYSTPLDTSMAAESSMNTAVTSLADTYVVAARNSSAVLLHRR